MILKSFDFQCDFDFQITTSKITLILNHLYLGDLIWILKSSTYRPGTQGVNLAEKVTNFDMVSNDLHI